MNLFFIHTPFQMLVAQNLIVKKKLKNNVLVLSNTGRNAEHFYEVFDVMLIKSKWNKKYVLGNLNNGIYSFKKPLISYIKLYKFSNKVKRIILQNDIKALYFGDINHPAYVFLAEYWQHKMQINFFEEGLSHYFSPILKKKFVDSLILKIKKYFTDCIIFKSLGVKRFSRYLQSITDTEFGFNIAKKYNILPINENSYDERIKFDIFLSDKLKLIIENENLERLKNKEQINVLYLSSTATSLFSNPIKDEISIISDSLKKIGTKVKLLIKFHPKDSDNKKKKILHFLNNKGVDFIVIFPDVSLPVEVLFNHIKIDFLIGFGSSSQLYFEMLCPGIPNYNLFHSLTNLYRIKSIENQYSEKFWINWQHLFNKIFNKNPLEF